MKQENKADIGIIGAMSIEVEALCAAMEDPQEERVGSIAFTIGTLGGRRVVCAKCGIGKVFAAMGAQAMILHYAPDVIVNSGVAGTLSPALSIGQIAIAEEVVQHDMDTTAFGDPHGYLSGIGEVYLPTDRAVTDTLAACVESVGVPYLRGTIASGDRFVDAMAEKDRIRAHFDTPDHPVLACEMEGAAIGQVCYLNGTPYGILRAISDGGDEQAFCDYPTFLAAAAKTATNVMLAFVERWGRA